MPVSRLDHVNICSDDVGRSAQFYTDLLDLEARDPPGPYPPDMAKWLYAQNGRAVIHLYKMPRPQGSTGVIHHVALDCTDKNSILERLRKSGAEFQTRQDGAASVIYTQDPHGLMLELYFANE